MIGKIRKNLWLVIVLLGLALAAFIIMDVTNSNLGGGTTDFSIGSIEGEKVDWNEFQDAERILYQGSSQNVYAQRDYLWNYFVADRIVKKESEKMGLGVSKEELLELQFGARLSPIVQRNFRDPQTGQMNRQQLLQFRTEIENGQLDDRLKPFWAFQEKEVIKDRLQTKINTLVQKAMFTPTWMVERFHYDNNNKVDFNYVKIAFDDIDDSEITVTDEDYENYIEENAALYETQEETRVIQYTVFNVLPTAEDSAAIYEELAELKGAFETAEDDSTFIENNFGILDDTYYTSAALTEVLNDTVFAMPVGSVFGPYSDNNAYNLVKLIDRKLIPDSVRSRHILIRANDIQQAALAQQTLDSLKNLIETGAESFDSLAVKFSQDVTSGKKGGDLGYAGQGAMVKPFNDMIFYKAEEGELNFVYSNFGVHLVEVTGRKFINNETGVRLAVISEPIVPSEETQNALYDKALAFISENRDLDALATSVEGMEGMTLETVGSLKKNDFTVGTLKPGQACRDMVRWAFDPSTSKGDVSPEVYIQEDDVNYFNSQYIVVGLKEIEKAGLPSVETLRDQVQVFVKNRKKAELIKERAAGLDLQAAASKFGTSIDTVSGANFQASFIEGLGTEPKVVAKALKMNTGDAPAVVEGNGGVYLIKVTNKQEAAAPTNIASLRAFAPSLTKQQIPSLLFKALKDGADIEDNRYTFY